MYVYQLCISTCMEKKIYMVDIVLEMSDVEFYVYLLLLYLKFLSKKHQIERKQNRIKML